MSIRTFIFCDFCNPLCVRLVDGRRYGARGDRPGRRVTDGRAWFEGDVHQAVEEHGWGVTSDGRHACPHCLERGLPDLVSAETGIPAGQGPSPVGEPGADA